MVQVIAFVSFVLAAVFFGVLAFGGTLTDHPLEFGLFFTAVGLALGALPVTAGTWRRQP